jgi:NAD(P)-dependent dehydrogenase (short-subunit alcohol dehydrogenase family)
VTSGQSVAAAVELIAADGGLDGLSNNAGIAGPREPVPDVTADDVRATYETNLSAWCGSPSHCSSARAAA